MTDTFSLPLLAFALMSGSMLKPTRFFAAIAFGVFALGSASFLSAEPDWSMWRGPTGDGHSTDESLPVEWSPEDIVWKTPLKGEGQSTPCVWGEHIFLTRSDNRGAERYVFCVNRADGKILWE